MEISSWDSFWAGKQETDFWENPAPEIVTFIENHPPRDFPRVLDLGAGLGRHALALARENYQVTAVDSSQVALLHLQERARRLNLEIKTVGGDYRQPLFSEGSFDLIIAYNVLYHGTRQEMVRAIHLCREYLLPGGLLFLTCPTRDDGKYGNGEELAPHTYQGQDLFHPGDTHYFSDNEDLNSFFEDWNILSRNRKEHYWKKDGLILFSSYWQVIARRPGIEEEEN